MLIDDLKKLAVKWRNSAEVSSSDMASQVCTRCAAELEALLAESSPVTVGLPPTAPHGGGYGMLADLDGFSTANLMEQKKHERRVEGADLSTEADKLLSACEDTFTTAWEKQRRENKVLVRALELACKDLSAGSTIEWLRGRAAAGDLEERFLLQAEVAIAKEVRKGG